MKPERIVSIYFSPTGGTARVSETISTELAARLNIEATQSSFTRPREREQSFSFRETDLVIVSCPTYAGKLPNKILPDLQSKLVQEVLKENYDFGFATVNHEIYDEAELEESLTKNVTDLLLEMGTGFAFLGRQKEILVGGRARKIDLLFYHIRLRCYVVCELKAKPFEPEFAGKLNYYVNAVDELMKSDDDNPTIGLLVCSDMDNIDVQWSFKGISTPMGVATYNNIRIKDALPSQEQLADRVRLLQKELQETKRMMKK